MSVSPGDDVHAPWEGEVLVPSYGVTRLDALLRLGVGIRGVVRTSAGTPSSGTAVTARPSGGTSVSVATNSAGEYSIGGLPWGEIALVASGELGSLAAVELFGLEGEWKEQDLVLQPDAVLTGRVVDASGRPIQDVSVTAVVRRVDWVGSTGVNARGEFSIARLPQEGRLQLIIAYAGEELHVEEIALPFSGDVTIVTSFLGVGALSARIVDVAGQVIPRATIIPVRPQSQMGQVHELGVGDDVFHIEHLLQGRYIVVLQAPGFARVRMEVDIEAEQLLDLGEVVLFSSD